MDKECFYGVIAGCTRYYGMWKVNSVSRMVLIHLAIRAFQGHQCVWDVCCYGQTFNQSFIYILEWLVRTWKTAILLQECSAWRMNMTNLWHICIVLKTEIQWCILEMSSTNQHQNTSYFSLKTTNQHTSVVSKQWHLMKNITNILKIFLHTTN